MSNGLEGGDDLLSVEEVALANGVSATELHVAAMRLGHQRDLLLLNGRLHVRRWVAGVVLLALAGQSEG